MTMLQWGHGDEAVEEVITALIVTPAGTLQWGHGDEAVEEAWRRPAKRRSMFSLQWGHGDEAVEERDLAGPLGQPVGASMGPRR